jgi:hypothetical protein
MLKNIYGNDHVRSMCFREEEARTGLQRKFGYAGGYNKEDYIGPQFL